MSVEAGGSNLGGGADGQGSDCEGEEQEDSSSSSLSDLKTLEDGLDNADTSSSIDALATFRQQWQNEIESSPIRSTYKKSLFGNNIVSDKTDDPKDETLEEKATRLFRTGVNCERIGKPYEAIQFYRRAVQLVPDIEFKLYEHTKSMVKQDDKSEDEKDFVESINNRESNEGGSDAIAEDDEEDLLIKIQRVTAKDGRVCTPELDPKSVHFSALPVELVLLVLKWVVSNELDVVSLEKLAQTCRGFYLCARDPEIWHLLCARTWGINCGTLKASNYASWRQMYLERPHLRHNGCYISKTTYLRHGENSFQDQFYRPWYLIEYYRYLRFFPDGTVLMLTTADEPAITVSQLKYRTTKSNQGVLTGHYRLLGDKVILVVKKSQQNVSKPAQQTNTRFRPRKKDQSQDSNQGQTFHLELQIVSARRRKFTSLAWHGYTIITRRGAADSTSSFDLAGTKFPPFWFSPVRSYHRESESALT